MADVTTVKVPDIEGPTAQLCWAQKSDVPGAMARCDRRLHHKGLHSWEIAADAPRSAPAPQRWQIACPSWHQADRPIICSWCNGTGLVAIYLAKDIDHGSEGDVPAQPPINGLDSIHLSQSEFREPLEQAEQATRNRDAILRSAAVPPGAADASEPHVEYADVAAIWNEWRRTLSVDGFTHSDGLRFIAKLQTLFGVAPAAPRDIEKENIK